ncbi:hypothetical protein [Actinoplanes sp. L3-i22]|uniref:hypothetical protein n=1 Tax=Actinoplanes sp. L3-i22 TaxID=2836373 RepID=UPI001C84A28A|nr:hypothetical protein [Actinoplanes sp. L3-i22]
MQINPVEERVVWEGRPVRRRLSRPTDIVRVPIDLAMLAFAGFGGVYIAARGSSGGIVLGVALVLLGVGNAGFPFVQRAVAFRTARFTVTTHRLIIRSGWNGNWTMAVDLNTLPPPVIEVEPDGSGSLAFGAFPTALDAFFSRRELLRTRRMPGEWSLTPVLWDIPDVKRVRGFVTHARKQPDGVYNVDQ